MASITSQFLAPMGKLSSLLLKFYQNNFLSSYERNNLNRKRLIYLVGQRLTSNSNLTTMAFTQPQTLLHYTQQGPDSPNAVLIPISRHNSNQYSQQQILVAAASVASGDYTQNRGDISTNNLNTSSLAKLVSDHASNPLSINLGSIMKSSSPNSDISRDSKLSNSKRKYTMTTSDEFGQRKEMRLYKNREAARECRRKKKEYVKCLENRVSNLEQQNKILMDEINRIKELYSLKSPKKTSTGLLETAANSGVKGYYESATIANVLQTTSLNNDLNRTQCVTTETMPTSVVSRLTVHGNDASRVSVTEAAGSQSYSNAVQAQNPSLFQKFRQETDSKDDSSSPCDLN